MGEPMLYVHDTLIKSHNSWVTKMKHIVPVYKNSDHHSW
jgi:hypothetical protein